MFSLLYDRGHYYASSKRVENLRYKIQAKKGAETSDKSIKYCNILIKVILQLRHSSASLSIPQYYKMTTNYAPYVKLCPLQ